MNSRVKTLSGETLGFFSGNVAPGVAEVGSLFPQFRASIWESGRQNVHRTVARARFHKEIVKNRRSWSSAESSRNEGKKERRERERESEREREVR